MKRLLAVTFASLLFLTLGAGPVEAAQRGLYVHGRPGPWAFAPENHPKQVVAPKGTAAAEKIRHARLGDIYRLHGINHGRYVVWGIIDTRKRSQENASAKPLYAKRMHIRGTDLYVFMDHYS